MDATGDANACRACLVANAAVASVVAVLPLAIVLTRGERGAILAAAIWMIVVLAYAFHRLRRAGYLPSAPTLARLTRLNRIVGPDARAGVADRSAPSPRNPAERPRQRRPHRAEG